MCIKNEEINIRTKKIIENISKFDSLSEENQRKVLLAASNKLLKLKQENRELRNYKNEHYLLDEYPDGYTL